MTPSRIWTLITSRLANRLKADLKDDRGVVLLVLAVGLLTAATTVLTTKVLQNETFKMESQVRGTTNFGKIEQALISHFVADTLDGNLYRLPCPSDPAAAAASFGTYTSAANRPSATSTSCNRNRGIVPFKALGLTPEDVKDGYGNYLTYVVSTNTSACNDVSVYAGTVADADGTTDSNSPFRYVLISHGENGAGAWRDNGAGAATLNNDANMSDAEDYNCPAGTGNSCAGTYNSTSQSISIRAQNLTEGTGYYDDTVFEPTPSSRYYVGNCEDLNGSTKTPTGTRLGYDPANAKNFTAGGDTASTDAPTIPSTANVDVNGDGTNESYVVNFGDTGTADAAAQATVLISKQTFPLNGHDIRFFTDAYFQQDTSSDSATYGNGIVFGFIGANDTSGNPTDVAATPATGGVDQYNGFASDGSNFFPVTLERFGLEIDTKNHRPTTPAATDIIDPDENHVAVVLGDVQHYDPAGTLTDNSGESTEDNGGKCVTTAELAGFSLGTSSGTAPENRASPPTSTNSTHQVASSFPPSLGTAANTDDESCLYVPNNNVWLEDGNPAARLDNGTSPDSGVSNVAKKSHMIRAEIHGYDGSNGCGAGFIRLDAWIWPTGTACPATPTTRCTDLTQDFPTATERPHVSQCIARPSTINRVRLAITQGIPAGANTEGDVGLRRTSMFATEVLPLGSKSTASTTYTSTTVSEQAVRNGLYTSPATAPAGDLTAANFDQSFVVAEQTDNSTNSDEIKISADFGTFDLDEDEGWGVTGVGFSDSEIDNIRPGVGIYSSSIYTDFLPVAQREKAVFTWSSKISRALVNLKDFADQEYTTTDFTTDDYAPEMERVRLRAYDTTTSGGYTQVGSDQIVEACVANHNTTAGSFNTSTAYGEVIVTSFGSAFDRLEIIPEPILDSCSGMGCQYLNSYSMFKIGAVRGCGSDALCGLSVSDSIQTSANETRAQCASLSIPTASGSGIGVGTEVRPDTFLAALPGATSGTSLQHSFIDVTSEPVGSPLGYAVYSLSGALSARTHATQGGFGIDNPAVFTQAQTIDTKADAPYSTTHDGDRETIWFRFNQTWNRFAIGLARFGTDGAGNFSERFRVRFYNGTTLVGTYNSPDVIDREANIDANCDLSSDPTNGRAEVLITLSSQADRLEIAAMPATEFGGSNQDQSEFAVRGIQPCSSGGGTCAVDYNGDDDVTVGNSDNDAGDNFCQLPNSSL